MRNEMEEGERCEKECRDGEGNKELDRTAKTLNKKRRTKEGINGMLK